jgi:hypothetical protein
MVSLSCLLCRRFSLPTVDMTAAIKTPFVCLNMLSNLSPIVPSILRTSLNAWIERMTEQTMR